MVKTENGIRYAVHLVTTHFGNLVAKVCECLLRKGPLTLQNILRYTDLSQTQVKNSLLVLIQHNSVQAFRLLEESGGGFQAIPKQTTHYIALFDNILHRLRFPKFLTVIAQVFESDKLCRQIVEGLLQHGRLSLKQIVDRANSTRKANSNHNQGNSIALDTVHEKLGKLLRDHFVERCPDAEPFVAPPTEEEIAAKKRGAKSAKILVKSQTLEDRVLAAAIPMDAKRFLPIEQSGGENDQNSLDKHAGDKRKLDASEPDIDSQVAEDQHVLWRANFEEFIRRLRHKASVEHVREHLDDGAAIVLSSMLGASRTEEKKVKIASSVPLSISSIYEEVIKSEKGRDKTFDHIRAVLDELRSPPPYVIMVDDSYSIDFEHIIEEAQRNEVESIVLKRYGRDAYRMFRLLSKAGRLLETDKISDTVFVEKKETTKTLYKLWQDEYLQMEKLVVGTATFLLWNVKQHVLWEHVLDDMFHAALNLSLRLSYELQQREEIVNLPEDKRVGVMEEKYEKFERMKSLMLSSLMKLDDAIMLFHDF